MEGISEALVSGKVRSGAAACDCWSGGNEILQKGGFTTRNTRSGVINKLQKDQERFISETFIFVRSFENIRQLIF